MEDSVKDAFVNLLNAQRKEVDVHPVVCSSFEQSMDYTKNFEITLEGLPIDVAHLQAMTDASLTEIRARFASHIAENEKLQNLIMSKDFTHVDSTFVIHENQEQAALKLQLFSRFLDIEPPGQVIDGDLVIQGNTLWLGDQLVERGPVLCTIEFARDHDENFQEVLVVKPWEMMFGEQVIDESKSAGGGDNLNLHTFAIPVQLPEKIRKEKGQVRVRIYVDEVPNIPYGEEVAGFNANCESYVCAVELHTQAIDSSSQSRQGSPRANKIATKDTNSNNNNKSSFEQEREIDQAGMGGDEVIDLDSSIDNEVPASRVGSAAPDEFQTKAKSAFHERVKPGDRVEFVNDVKIALDFDDLQAFVSEGMDSNAVALTEDGPVYETEHMWKFHVVASHQEAICGEPNYFGVEDVMWIRTLKAMGTLPAIPNYEVIDSDLLSTEGDFSIFLAVRRGKNPRFKNISVISCPIDLEDMLKPFLSGRRSHFKQAPAEICQLLGGVCGVMLQWLDEFGDVENVDSLRVSTADGKDSSNNNSNSNNNDSGKLGRRASTRKMKSGDSSSSLTIKSDSALDSSSLVEVGDQEKVEDENSDCSEPEDDEPSENELQAKLEKLQEIHEDQLQVNQELQRKAALLIAREKMNTGQTSVAKTAEAAAQQASQDAEQNPEAMQEKYKQYLEGIQLITDGKKKYNRQVGEFDQLAADLQTRLDDKEYKATEVTESFRKFKRDILSKSINSRTGMPLASRLTQQIIEMEAKRDEDLEKVRLRNISLRTGLKKLDRALRSKEQLAEGLHMIDFEQLKIENTTLNEKIEERTDEVNKLKRKRTVTLQMLTHLREKLRHTNKGNDKLKIDLVSLEGEIDKLRGDVTSNKHDRSVVQSEVKNLKQSQGFTTNDLLIVDFESRKSQLEEVKATVREYKDRYDILERQVERGNNILAASGISPSGTALSPINSPIRSPKKNTLFGKSNTLL